MEVYMGTIMAFGFNFAPSGWQQCNGQTLAIQQYSALFALLGTNYGGNGQTTFQLPNLQGRVPIHQGQLQGGSTYVIGQVGGTENTAISVNNMPSHTHVATFTPSGGGGITATLKASALAATQSVPGTQGANTLGAPGYGSGRTAQTVFGYVADANPAVALTGLSVSGGSGGTVTNAGTGNGLPISNLSPYLTVNYCIAITGSFPSRN